MTVQSGQRARVHHLSDAINQPSLAFEPDYSEMIGRHPDYGDRDLIYRDRTFPIHLSAAEVAMLDSAAVEHSGYIGHRWWLLDELDVATEPVYPEGLADVIRRIPGSYG